MKGKIIKQSKVDLWYLNFMGVDEQSEQGQKILNTFPVNSIVDLIPISYTGNLNPEHYNLKGQMYIGFSNEYHGYFSADQLEIYEEDIL